MEPELEIPEHPPAAPQARRANWWPRLIAAGAALIAGAGAAVVHSPFSLWLGLLGYPLLMILFERAGTGRGAFGLGWLAGFAYFFISCWWVAEAFLVNAEAHAWMAPFAASLLPAGLALFWGLAGVLHRRLAPRTALRPLFFAAVFCGLEWLRGHVLTGFPWNPAGAGWAAGSAPSQAAAWLGVYGLGFVTVAAAAALAPLFGPGSIKARLGVAVLGLVALGALFVAGEVRLAGARTTLTPTVVRIVQADVQQQAKWDEANFNAIVQRYVNLTSRPGAATPDVIVWPEGALPAVANDVFAGPVGEAIARALEPGQVLLAGLSRAEQPDEGGDWRYYNSLFALHDEGPQLRVAAVYDKHRLVPFGEYLPLGRLMTRTGLRSLVHVPSDFSAGPRPSPIALPGPAGAVQPLICYESLYPGFTGRGQDRPAWIANVSNDAWFGRTSGPQQHLNLAAYRAIEEGLPMVRATPTGVSALIDPWGRIDGQQRLEPGESGVIDARLPAALPPTLYARIGDALFFALLALGLATLVRKRTFP